MFQLKVQSIGGSLGIALPDEVVARLNLKEGDMLLLTDLADGSMRLAPREAAFVAQMRAARRGLAKHRNVLRQLAARADE